MHVPVAVREQRGLDRCPGLQQQAPLLQAFSLSSPWNSALQHLMMTFSDRQLSLVSLWWCLPWMLVAAERTSEG